MKAIYRFVFHMLCVLCLIGCKREGAIKYEIYTFNASQSMVFDMTTYSLKEDPEIPPIEFVKINYTSIKEGKSYIRNIKNIEVKIHGKPKKTFNAHFYSNGYMHYGWEASDNIDEIQGMDMSDMRFYSSEHWDIVAKFESNYYNEYGHSPYFINVNNRAWYAYPIIEHREVREFGSLPKSYFE